MTSTCGPTRQAPGALGLGLLVLGGWLRFQGQVPFQSLLTHHEVGRVLLEHAAWPWTALAGHLVRLAGQVGLGLVLPDLLLAAGLVLVARAWPGRPWNPPPRLDLVAALAGALGATLVCGGVFGFQPFSSDEASYFFQARLFGSGSLTVPSPAPLAAFHQANLVNDGQWYSQYSPGWAAALAPFVALGVPGLLPALVGAAALLFPYRLARTLLGPEAAAGTLLLLAASPAVLLSAGTFFPHAAQAALTCAALDLAVRGSRRDSGLEPLAAGLLLGLVLLARPVETALLALLLPPFLALEARSRGRRLAARVLLLGLAGLALPAGLLAAWQLRILGTFYEAASPEARGHSLPAALWNTAYRLARLGFWAAPLSLPLALAAPRGPHRILALGGLGLLTAGFAFFYNLGQVEVSTRYLLVGWVLFTLPAGAAIAARRPGVAAVAAWLVVALAACWPGPVRTAREAAEGGRVFRAWLDDQAAGCVVFLRNTPQGVARAFVRNRPDLAGPTVQALFLDPSTNQAVRRAFPDRPAAVLDWDLGAGNWVLHPFEAPRNPEEDALVAGINRANSAEDPEGALALWARIPDASPVGPAARQNEIRLLAGAGRHAEVVLRARGRDLPPDLRLEVGLALWHLGRRDEARQIFEALRDDPGVGDEARGWARR